MKKLDVGTVLEVITDALVEVKAGTLYAFVLGRNLYVYNDGSFLSYLYRCDGIETKGSSLIVKHENSFFEVITDGLVDMSYFKELGYPRGGVNGVSYTGLTLSMDGLNYKVYGHTVAAAIKYGSLISNYCLGKGSYYVIDHIDEDKRNNQLENLRILTRRDNRWRK